MAAVVATLIVKDCICLPRIGTEELGRLQVGAGVTTGVMTQLRSTDPVNDLVGASSRVKLAVCPAVMAWDVGEPVAGPLRSRVG
ncbi:MAG: hypothetical protein WB566_04410 [Terriglobales bacterium]